MPSKRPATTDLQDFIAPDHDDLDDGAERPPSKKPKLKSGKPKERGKDTNTKRDKSDGKGGAGDKKATAKAKGKAQGKKEVKGGETEGGKVEELSGGGKRDAKGDEFWDISTQRRVVLSQFAGKRMVGLREYYEKGGEMLPGKKGISLTLDQFNTVIELLPHIESALVAKGETVSRPDYNQAAQSKPDDEDGNGEGEPEDEDEEEEEEEEAVSGGKKNFEETSEDEE